eukprot:8940191-Pyramimonas_sp.AAC.1
MAASRGVTSGVYCIIRGVCAPVWRDRRLNWARTERGCRGPSARGNAFTVIKFTARQIRGD